MDIALLSLQCGSRREARRQSRREAIVEVAGRSFLEHGYAATTMSAIAAELGGSKGTLWSYFPAKDLLFAAVLDHTTAALRQQLTVLFNPNEEPEATLRQFARTFLERVTSPEALALHRLVVSEANRFPETGRIFNERAMGRTQAQVAAYLAEMTVRGLLSADDADLAAQQLIGLCISGCYRKLMLRLIERPDAKLIEADALASVDSFMRAYRPGQACRHGGPAACGDV